MREIMPANVSAEKTVLVSCLIFKDLLDEFAGLLEPGDFYSPANYVIFETMIDLYAKGIPVDVSILKAQLEGCGKLEQIGGYDYLSQLLDEPTAVDPIHYAALIRDKKIKRQLIETANACMKDAYLDGKPADELLDYFQQKFLALGSEKTDDCTDIADLVVTCSDTLETLHNNPGGRGIVRLS